MAGLLGYALLVLPAAEYGLTISMAINILTYGCLSLLSFLVYRQETYFRSIFFQFWFFFAVFALSAPVTLHVVQYYGTTAGIAAWIIGTIVLHGLFAWTIAKVLFHYIFHDEKRWAINLLSALVVLPLCGWLLWPYWWNPLSILDLPTAANADTLYTPVQKAMIVVNIFFLVMLLAFFLHKLRTDKPIGVFADTLLFLFGLMVLVDTVESVFQINSLELLNITQWANGIIAGAMIVTLILRLHYKSQTIANYYESQLLSYDPRVGRRIGVFDRIILRCFFDPQKVGERIFLGTGGKKMTVKRTSPRVARPVVKDE